MSGDWMAASGLPFFRRAPGSARMRETRPVTGEKTCATRRSSKVTLPLVTTSLPTAWVATGSMFRWASATCCSVSQTSPFGGCVAAGLAGAV